MKKVILLISAVVLIMSLSAESMIRLKVKEFNTDIPIPKFETEALNKETMSGAEDYFLVQFSEPVRPHHKDRLISMGAEFIDYIPDNAFIVRMDEETFSQTKNISFVKFIQLWQPGYKIAPYVLRTEHMEPQAELEGNNITLLITLFNERGAGQLAEFLNKRNMTDYEIDSRFARIRILPEQARELAVELAGLNEVYWIERDFPIVLHNAWSRWISDSYARDGMSAGPGGQWYAQLRLASPDDSSRLAMYAHSVFGTNQIVSVDDTGLDWDNIYFRDNSQPIYYDKDSDTICESPNYLHRKVVAYNAYVDTFDLNSSGHGTHTSGSVAGDSLGSNFPGDTIISRAAGMAPNAQLMFVDLGGSGDGIYTPLDYNRIYTWAYNGGARITSSSWGPGAPAASSYTGNSRQLDDISWKHKDLIMFRSAGNDNNIANPDSINTPATAKNIVTVGASESGFGYGSTSWSDVGSGTGDELNDVAEFSSHGPTKEGQMKPELIVPGGWYIWSADSDGNLSTNNTGITYMGGTSMSCPTAAGFAALIRQYFTDGYYPTGLPSASDSINPSGALIKAMLINSTRNSPGRYSIDDLDHVGMQNAPSMGQGWGRITVNDAAYFDGDTRDLLVYDERDGFTTAGEFKEYQFITDASLDEYIKIVLVYTDYPASPAPASVVVNDLNLTVIAGANTYKGNVFGTEARSVTGGSYDSDNVTEVVWLDSLPNTNITVRVDADAVNSGPQPYALVITGDIKQSGLPSGIIYHKSEVYDTLSTGTVISDGILNNGETADIDLWITNTGDSLAGTITAELINNSPYSSTADSNLVFDNLSPGDSASQLIRVAVSENCPDNTFLPFTLISHYNAVQSDTSYFNLQVSGTSIVSLDRDSLLIETDVAKSVSEASEYVLPKGTSRKLYKTDIISPVKAQYTHDTGSKGLEYDTLMHDDGTVSTGFLGVNRFAVKFAPVRACSVKAIWWSRYTNNDRTDTLFVNENNSGVPGSKLFEKPVSIRGTSSNTYYRNTVSGPIVNDSFFVSLYTYTAEASGDTAYLNADAGGGQYSYFYDDSVWSTLAGIGFSNDLMIRAEVKYFINIADSGMFYVVNNDTASVKDIAIDTVIVRNSSTWIVDIDPYSGTVSQNDSLGIKIYIDTTGLLPDTVYRDTLEIYTDADMSKAVMLELPVVLRTTQSSGIETPQIPSVEGLPLENSLSVDNRLSRRPVINYALSSEDMVRIDVFDVSGRLIDNIVNADKPAGRHTVIWDKSGIAGLSPSGVFFIRARIGNDIIQERIISIK
ncbi:MAG: S8 family serine peptidase [candidate division WOR-3 bacterium]|nr:S8 family serine peptidase [candidate division WOR-3 bacterium]